jgi:hypothetical protein
MRTLLETIETKNLNPKLKLVLGLLPSGLIPHLVGPKGEGKTSFVKDLSKVLGLTDGLVIMNLSAVESTDFCGLPYIDKASNVTKYAKPNFLTAKVLFLDEVDRVRDSSVKASLLSLLIDKSINGNELNPDCIVITAGNGKYDIDETIEMTGAYKDRFIEIDFAYSDEEKIEYFSKRYPENPFVKFLTVKPEILRSNSSRRIEAFLKVDNSLCSYLLGTETARLFKHYIESNLVTLGDIKKGTYDFNGLSAISKSSLILDIVQGFFDIKNDEAKNVNKFINLLRAEEKSNYFTKLKKLCLENPEKFQKKANELNGHDMFKSQKDFLAELTK